MERHHDQSSGELPFDISEEKPVIPLVSNIPIPGEPEPWEKEADAECKVCGGGIGGCPQCGSRNSRLFDKSEIPRLPRLAKPGFPRKKLKRA